MQDYASPENYQGGNLLTIKKIAEKLRLENHRAKINYQLPDQKNDLSSKENHVSKVLSTRETFKLKPTYFIDIRKTKLDYRKLLASKRISNLKRGSLLIKNDYNKANENKTAPIERMTSAGPAPQLTKPHNVNIPTRTLFGVNRTKTMEVVDRQKAIDRFRWAIKMVRAWLRYLNYVLREKHRYLQKYLFSIESLKDISEFPTTQKNDLKFNKNIFKATKEIDLTQDMKKILNLHPKERSEEQIYTIMYGLMALSAFNEYPAHLQKKICTVAYFRKIDPRRVIIRQGHVAENFYFIISGTAMVTYTSQDNSGKVRTVNSLSKGSSFGELALLHHSKRTASVVSVTSMQLLAIERNDFFSIFMQASSQFSKYPEHVSFIKEIPIFCHLDLDQLVALSENCLCHFYKDLVVISANDIESEWVYIVKSGSCTVLKELQIPVERKLIRENTLTLNDIKSKMQRFEDYHFLPMVLQSTTGNTKSKTRYLWRSRTILQPGDYFYLKDESENIHNQEKPNGKSVDYVSVFIKVVDLMPKDIYGLSSVIFSTEDNIRTENMASVTLVSNKAEMILISKKFLIQKSNEDLIKDIRQSVRQYPSEDVFLENYKTRFEWDKYKMERYHSTLKRLN